MEATGKTVIPFAASGMNGIGESGKNMRALAQGAKALDGKRFDANAAERSLLTGARSGCERNCESVRG